MDIIAIMFLFMAAEDVGLNEVVIDKRNCLE